ncbi:Peptidase-M28 domain-containing protein [Aphelenchoides bicaudatus]|nr:Peptidase-M28 domain-containing protein [Aphelenchoides bicaudatus]
MLLVGGIIVGCVYLFGMTMCWYATPILVFFIYIFPMMAVGFWVHSVFVCRERGDRVKARMDYKFLQNRIYRLSETLHLDTESAHYDATLIIYSVFLLLMTIFGILSAYIFMIVVVFGLLREPILFAYEKITKKDLSSQIIFIVQTICLSPAFFLLSYCANLFIGFFIPVMGRFGNSLLPELFIMPLALVISLLFVLLTANLVYLTRPCSLLFKIVLAFYLLIFVIIISTRIGNPYKWRNDGSPRLRRLIAIHTKRTAYEYDGRIKSSDVGMFYQSMDYRGVGDLPKHSLFNGSRPDCSQFSDAYCQLPYYTPVLSMMPWEKSSWVQTNDEPSIKSPLKIELLDRHSIDDSKFGQHINFSISVKGGMDKMQLHLTPLRGYKLKALSFIQLDLEKKVDDSYFVFWTYGYKAPEERRFWNNTEIKETNKSASLEIVAVTHQVHGPYQQSKSLSELQNKIVEQRTSDWKWGITLTYGTSEVVSNLF